MSLEAIRAFAEQYEAQQPAPEDPPAGAQITILEGGRTPQAAVWEGEGWAVYQAIYAAVEGFHKRHRNMDGTIAAWVEALEDVKRISRKFDNTPLVLQLLSAVYGELERTAPRPPATPVDITKASAYAK